MIEELKERARRLGRDLRRVGKKSETTVRLYEGLSGGRRRFHLEVGRLRGLFAGNGGPSGRVDPKNLVWIFGSGRSGSTWLRAMMAEVEGVRFWEEPMVGRLFGEFYARSTRQEKRSADFILGDPIRRGWIGSIRTFILEGAAFSNPRLGPEDLLVVKEPNGSVGAPLIMEALPESRMVLLVRDPRDVVASVVDAATEGGWLYERRNSAKGRGKADKRPVAFAATRARAYRDGVGNASEAFDAHRGPRALVRYEDLVSDTAVTLGRVFSELGIPATDEELSRIAEKHSWENVPDEEKGRGKFYRKGRPGGWREDLSPAQVEAVEKITGPLMDRFYPGGRTH